MDADNLSNVFLFMQLLHIISAIRCGRKSITELYQNILHLLSISFEAGVVSLN